MSVDTTKMATMSVDTNNKQMQSNQIESKRETVLSSSLQIESKHEILLKDIPGILDYMPDDVDLNCGINAPLKKLQDGSPYNGDSCALVQAVDTWCLPDLVEILLEHRADPNTTANMPYATNVTVLMLASFTKRARSVKKLLEYGADFRIKDSNGFTALDWAGHYCPPGQPLQQHQNQYFFLPDQDEPNKNETYFPLFVAMYKYYYEECPKQIQKAFALIGTTVPKPICQLINQYIFGTVTISLALSNQPRYLQVKMLKMMKRAYENDCREQKLNKLLSLSETELDHLLATHQTRAAVETHQARASLPASVDNVDGSVANSAQPISAQPMIFNTRALRSSSNMESMNTNASLSDNASVAKFS